MPSMIRAQDVSNYVPEDPKIITRKTLTSFARFNVCLFKRFEDENKYFIIIFDAVKCKYSFIN